MAHETTESIDVLEHRLRDNAGSLSFARLADTYRKRGDVQRAITVCAQGLQHHPDYTTGRIILGRCYLEQENLPSAINEFTRVCQLDRRNQVAIKMLADIYVKQQLPEKAGDLYGYLTKNYPDNPSLAHLARSNQGTGNEDLFAILNIVAEPVAFADTAMYSPHDETRIHPRPDSRGEEMEPAEMDFDTAVEQAAREMNPLQEVQEVQEMPALIEETILDHASAFDTEVTGDDVSKRMSILFQGDDTAVMDLSADTGAIPAHTASREFPADPFAVPLTATDTAETALFVKQDDTASFNPEVSGSDVTSRIDELFGDTAAPAAPSALPQAPQPPPPAPRQFQATADTQVDVPLPDDFFISDDAPTIAFPRSMVQSALQDDPAPSHTPEEPLLPLNAAAQPDLFSSDTALPQADDISFAGIMEQSDVMASVDDLFDDKPHDSDMFAGITGTTPQQAPAVFFEEPEPQPLPQVAGSGEENVNGSDIVNRLDEMFTPDTLVSAPDATLLKDDTDEISHEAVSAALELQTGTAAIGDSLEEADDTTELKPENLFADVTPGPGGADIFSDTLEFSLASEIIAQQSDSPEFVQPAIIGNNQGAGSDTALDAPPPVAAAYADPFADDVGPQMETASLEIPNEEVTGKDVARRIDELFGSDTGSFGPAVTMDVIPDDDSDDVTVGSGYYTVSGDHASHDNVPQSAGLAETAAYTIQDEDTDTVPDTIFSDTSSEFTGKELPTVANDDLSPFTEPLALISEAVEQNPVQTTHLASLHHTQDMDTIPEDDDSDGTETHAAEFYSVSGEDAHLTTYMSLGDLPSAHADLTAAESPHAEPPEPVSQPAQQHTDPAGDQKQETLYAIPDHVLTPTLADIYYHQGQPQLALQIYRRLVELDPENERIAARLTQIEHEMQNMTTTPGMPVQQEAALPVMPQADERPMPRRTRTMAVTPTDKPLVGKKIKRTYRDRLKGKTLRKPKG